MGDLLKGWDGNTITSDQIGNIESDGTWTYIWEHGRQLKHMEKSGVTIDFEYDANGPMSLTVNGEEYYYVQNAQGDVAAIITEAGEKVVEYRWRFLEQYKYFLKEVLLGFRRKFNTMIVK